MATTFLSKLEKLTVEAQHYIEQTVTLKKEVILFSASDNDDEEWTKDIYDEVPDFPFYDKHGFVGYAAVKEIRLQEHSIEVTGILKGDNYPDEAHVLLNELDACSSAALADYLHDLA